MKVYVFWGTYDGARLEVFGSHDAAAMKVADIMRLEEADENGTQLMGIVEGTKLEVEMAKRVSIVTLKKARDE